MADYLDIAKRLRKAQAQEFIYDNDEGNFVIGGEEISPQKFFQWEPESPAATIEEISNGIDYVQLFIGLTGLYATPSFAKLVRSPKENTWRGICNDARGAAVQALGEVLGEEAGALLTEEAFGLKIERKGTGIVIYFAGEEGQAIEPATEPQVFTSEEIAQGYAEYQMPTQGPLQPKDVARFAAIGSIAFYNTQHAD